ncbi:MULTISPECIES: hypothetical protein [Bifidobacterium]|jgi:hypothetical protein|uniref:hypothetical protein n=1 Tax=Bifidobacterium TaxID=1678 RepID=UPI002355DBA7|nr:hypothetical protein [Bifidobacterium tibiigranuli]MCI1791750.1 hypothetical protein [Bifidobacterium tibiigranuli]MCI1797455.1 hypothetical protein [Bifidobacterium tibiigranuli]MCI2186242.1 hypothetical protein [Bifidobacterium tibiigranuli]MCI2203932.1 hypothetical protein [Bifidobacterium tibiigranuli]
MKLRNISPLGALYVPWLGRSVGRGETVDIEDSDAQYFLPQSEVWQRSDDAQDGEAKQ